MSAKSVKVMLGLGGVLFLLLSLLLLFVGMGSEIVYSAFFFLVGVGFLIALEWYAAKLPKPPGFVILESAPDAPLTPEVFAAAQVGQGGGGEGSAAMGSGGSGEAAVAGDSAARMSHLEQADFLCEKVKTLPSDDAVAALIQQTLGDLEQKGYSKKGLDAFFGRLTGCLNSAANAMKGNEQVMKNFKRAMQILEAKRSGGG